MSKTIKEIADELGVSKTAIRNKMTDDFRKKWVQTSTANGVQTLVITEEGVNALKSIFRGGNHTANLGANFTENQFAPNNDFKDELKAKNEQIEKLQKLLDQSQQLLLSEQKKSQLLIESHKTTIKFDDYLAEQLKDADFKQGFLKEKEKLEKQVELYRSNSLKNLHEAEENKRKKAKIEKALWFVVALAGVLLVLLVILTWLYLVLGKG